MKSNPSLDLIDLTILDFLQADSRITNVEIARQINLSPPAVHTRIKRLEQDGYIRQYAALLDREMLGFDMLCFIQVSLQVHQPEVVNHFRECIAQIPQVLECHHLTGDIDYLIKIVVRNQHDLQRFLMEQLTPIPGIARIHTSLALTEIKSTPSLPIHHNEDGLS